MAGRRIDDTERDRSVLDASLNCLIGDGEKTKDVLFKIKTGAVKGPEAREALREARYLDWKTQTKKED